MKLRDRAVRAGISVFLCILVSKLLDLKYPFFVALPSVMPIASSIEETLKAGRNRMLGTIIGAVTGIVFAFIAPGNSILGGLGIIVILYLCNFIRWGTSASIAGLVFISIMVGIKGENPWNYSLNRISDTLIGILITILVNNIIFHKNLADILNKDFKDMAKKFAVLLKEKHCLNKKIELTAVLNELESVKDQFHIYEEEIKLRKSSSSMVSELKSRLNVLINTYEHMKIISEMDVKCTFDEINKKKFMEIFNKDYSENYYSEKDSSYTYINIVYNYHLGHILNNLTEIRKKLDIIF